MATFVLIHGGLHGAWCWQPLQAELAALGHRTVAMDLPVDQPGKGIADYARAVSANVPAGRVYLVGHSLGGYVAPLVAMAHPDARIVMLCAGFPPIDEDERAQALAAIDSSNYAAMIHDDLDRISAPPDLARRFFFADVPAERADWAAARLRPQWIGAFTECPIVPAYGDRIAAIIACDGDGIAPLEEQRRQAARHGVDLHLLPGGHSPFLAIPHVLARTLDDIARRDEERRG